MTSNAKTLSALMHSIALLQSANGDKTEMKNIIEHARQNASSSKSMTVDEESFTFTNRSCPKKCTTKIVAGVERKSKVLSSKHLQSTKQATASLA